LRRYGNKNAKNGTGPVLWEKVRNSRAVPNLLDKKILPDYFQKQKVKIKK